MASARVIIADHGELFARGISELLTARGYEVLGIAPTSEEALALAGEHPDGLVLVDESIDGEGAASLIRDLLAKNPRQQTIVLNGSWSLSEVVRGLAAGAVGVIDKGCAPEHLFAAIDIVGGGGMVFSSEAVETLRDQLTEVFDLVAQRNARRLALTPREMEVLGLLPTSMTLTQMAAAALRLAQDHPEQRLLALPQVGRDRASRGRAARHRAGAPRSSRGEGLLAPHHGGRGRRRWPSSTRSRGPRRRPPRRRFSSTASRSRTTSSRSQAAVAASPSGDAQSPAPKAVTVASPVLPADSAPPCRPACRQPPDGRGVAAEGELLGVFALHGKLGRMLGGLA